MVKLNNYKKYVRNIMLTYVSIDKRCCSKMCTLHNLIHIELAGGLI